MGTHKCGYCGRLYGDQQGYASNARECFKAAGSGYCSLQCYLAGKKANEELAAQKNAEKLAKIEAKEAKRQAKERKQEKKAAEAADKLEKSKTTSQESLEKITRLCMIGGIVGLHRFAVGKAKSAILLDLVIVVAIFEAFFSAYGFQPSFLGLLLVNVAFWLFDLAQLKAKKFTDKYGYTIRE